MQSNIFELIDLLVKMSGSKSNIDELKADLEDTNQKITQTERKLSDLEEEMTDEKYFDASSEIVDRNIKISLVKKLQKYNKIKLDIENELENVKGEEKLLHDELEDTNEEIKTASEYNGIINKNEDVIDAYENMMAIENDRITKLIEKKDNITDEYDKIAKKVEYLASSLEDINDKISKEEERLNDIDNNLSNIKTYIDIEAKEEDVKRYLKVKEELDTLISHKNDIIEDPVYIAGLIKEYIANDNKEEVEKEFSHLIDIVKSIPYMDLENDEISSEMQKLDEELKNYDIAISNKEYQTLDSLFIDERINYLEEDIKKIKNRTEEIENRIKDIREENDLLSSKIFNAEKQIDAIDVSLVDYENYDYENSEIPKSVVQAAYNKLKEERKNIRNITENYRKDLLNNINEYNLLTNAKSKLDESFKDKENELDELNKAIALNTKSRNILEETKDRIELDKINNKILNLKNREQFTKSISSILDEFEMLNSSLEFVDKKTRTQRIIVNPDNSKEEEKIEETDNSLVNEEVIPSILPIDEIKEEKEEKEKLRVVEIIPITDEVSEKKEEKDFMVNDFQDDDYIDINTFMNAPEDK